MELESCPVCISTKTDSAICAFCVGQLKEAGLRHMIPNLEMPKAAVNFVELRKALARKQSR